jgi:hypothetical protein
LVGLLHLFFHVVLVFSMISYRVALILSWMVSILASRHSTICSISIVWRYND